MPFRLTRDGQIECDTLDEALALQERVLAKAGGAANGTTASKSQAGSRTGAKDASSATTQPDYEGLVAALPPATRKLLSALARAPQGLNSAELAEAISMETKSLPPILRSVRVQGDRFGFAPDGLILRENLRDGDGGHSSEYKLNGRFAEELRSRL